MSLSRVNYNSQFEIVFLIGSGVTELAVAADPAVSLFIKWEAWKLNLAAAQEVSENAAHKSLRTQFMKAQYEDAIASGMGIDELC